MILLRKMPAAISTAPMMKNTVHAVLMAVIMRPIFRAPYICAMITDEPMPPPTDMQMNSVVTGAEAPTAASACLPQ